MKYGRLSEDRIKIVVFGEWEERRRERQPIIVIRSQPRHLQHTVFPGEGHGFRIDSNIRRALEAELSFYAQVWGLDSPEEYRDAIRVENLN